MRQLHGALDEATATPAEAPTLSWELVQEWRNSPHFVVDTFLILLALAVVGVVAWERSGEGKRSYSRLYHDRNANAALRRMRSEKKRKRSLSTEDILDDDKVREVMVEPAAAGLLVFDREIVGSSDQQQPRQLHRGPFRVELRSGSQHTLRWDHVLRAASAADAEDVGTAASQLASALLPAGECNLYHFPTVTLDGSDAFHPPVILSGARLEVLSRLILAVCGAPTPSALPAATSAPPAAEDIDVGATVVDASGALILHALALANTNASVDTCLALMARRPALIAATHSSGMFAGETVLHVLAVNRRQEDSLALLALAEEHLADGDGEVHLHNLLNSPAVGEWFEYEPCSLYGASPLSFLCAFGADKVLSHILSTPVLSRHVRLNNPTSACPISGFLPLHVAAAHDRVEVYNLLLTYGADPNATTQPPLMGAGGAIGEPAGLRADSAAPLLSTMFPSLFTRLYPSPRLSPKRSSPRGPAAELGTLVTPLQLACQMGHTATVEQILKGQRELLWRWGPINNYQLDLNGIDSVTDSLSLMDLVCQDGFPKACSEMILDSFLEG